MMSFAPKLSVSNSLLLTAIVALGIAYYRSMAELTAARSEVRSLRSDIGMLTVENDSEINVLGLPAFGPNEWRWRVYLPTKGNYRLCYAFSEIPVNGIPKWYMQDDNVLSYSPSPTDEDGSFVLTAGLYRDLNGDMKLVIRGNHKSSVHDPGAAEWFKAGKPEFSITEGISSKTTASAATALTLLRWRRGRVTATGTTVEPFPTDGAMFWIEKID